MKDTFSLNRIRLLLERYFVENVYREILFWSIIALIFTVFDQRTFVITVLFISGLFFSANLFKQLWQGNNSTFYMLLPATHTEKLIATIFLSSIYHFGMTVFAYTIGNMLVTLIYHTMLRIDIPVSWDLFYSTSNYIENGFMQTAVKNEFWEIWGKFAVMQAIVMVGALYFKRYATLKTIASIGFLVIILIAIQLLFFKTVWDVKHLHNAFFNVIVMYNDGTLPPVLGQLLSISIFVLIPYFWMISYFKLKERQG